MPFLSSLDNLLQDEFIILKKVLTILRKSTKHANLGVGVQYPLKTKELRKPLKINYFLKPLT